MTRRRVVSIWSRFRLRRRPVWTTDTSHHFDAVAFAENR